MTVFLLSFVIIALLIAGMAIGVIVSNKPIKGSCGGMTALGIDTECDICGGDPKKCDEENASDTDKGVSDLAYEVSNKVEDKTG
ncbi:MAG: (Na+)-NQR maturation NqrM [Agarilytica sp.]